MSSGQWIAPDWPAPSCVRAITTTRKGGVSKGPYESMNPAAHVGDDPQAVALNRQRLRQQLELPGEPVWLTQVHGTTVVDAAGCGPLPQADAAYACEPGVVCAVLTADCLPVLLCGRDGGCAAAVHAGWRGLAAGIIERAVAALPASAEDLLAWLGPAISPAVYTVGDEVREAFISHRPEAEAAFQPGEGCWQADLYELARQRLAASGVSAISGGERCTAQEPETFFSYRRDGTTGRMASLIWLE